MPHRVYKYVHLQLFNVKYKFVHHQLLEVKFLFSKTDIFRKQKRMAFYGCTSLVLNFKFIWENDDLLSSRHRQIFEVLHPAHEYIKICIPNKRYQTNTVYIFLGTSSASALRYLGIDYFGRSCTKMYEKQEKLER